MRRTIASLAASGMALAICSSTAFATLWEANLSGLNEVPPNGSPGSGYALFDVNMVTGAFSYSVTAVNLTSAITMAHIHNAPAGANGPAIFTIFAGGTWTNPMVGAGTFTAPQLHELQIGNLYVNVHTQTFPGGEIRGQITLVPEPGTAAALVLGVTGLLTHLKRRRA